MLYNENFGKTANDLDGTLHQISAATAMQSLAMPELWIGAIVGLVMIVGAIRLRRWRDEG
jgi:ABC-2 type transport system permease protein